MNYIPHRVLFVVFLITGLILLYLINNYWQRIRITAHSSKIRNRILHSLKDTETLANSIVIIKSILVEFINEIKSTLNDALLIWHDGQNIQIQQLLENNILPLNIEEYINDQAVYSKKPISFKKSKNGLRVYLQVENVNSSTHALKIILFFKYLG